ncbi:YaaC family protein [Variovorax sp. CCNWLW225]|uniref:YaaC family protein n=1 Tax=Variovorax sp. CCNWLW225 TaxID=3127462 RepID=UPI00307749D1
MKLAASRVGERLRVNNKLIPYSFWPTKLGPKGNASLQTLLFSLDPWSIIDQSIKTSCPQANRLEALACTRQARDFYEGAVDSQRVSARPLSLYYCFMNLVKAFCLTKGTQTTFNKAQHGLSEMLRPANRELTDAFLRAFPSPNARGDLQNFSEFMAVLNGAGLTAQIDYDLSVLLPQILPGHRLWSSAANKKERFVAIHEIRTFVSKTTRELWLGLYFVTDDLSRIGVSHKTFLVESGLAASFAQVACSETDGSGRSLVCFQQNVPIVSPNTKYGNSLQQLFNTARPFLWATVATIPPYRRHYVYLRPPVEAAQTVSQLLSIYAVAYYLGSITRYRPHHFPLITDGPFGPRVQDFITGQPQQFLYLLASEFSRREIAKPSIL